MCTALTIRRAGPEDVDLLTALDASCFATPWSRDSFAREMEHCELAFYLIAEKNGRVVGYAGFWLIVDEGHITNVGVIPQERKRGIGRELMEQLIALAARQGAERLTLEVRPSNQAARMLYRNLRFEEAGRRPGYYEDNGEDAIIMWRRERSG